MFIVVVFHSPGVRDAILDTEDHMCPSCHDVDISPDRLIANKSLRTAVMNFLNETGYSKIKKKHMDEKMATYHAEAARVEAANKRGGITVKLLRKKTSPDSEVPKVPG